MLFHQLYILGLIVLLYLLLNRLLHGFAFGIAGTATGTIIAQVIPMSRKGEGIGYFALSMTLATAIGAFSLAFLS